MAPAGRIAFSGTPAEIERLVNMRQADSRAEVGPDGAVMFDAHCARAAAAADSSSPPRSSRTTCCSSKKPPCRATSRSSSDSKQQIRIPLATGERDRTIWDMIPYLQERCIDILQPDCAHTGGITQMQKIATLAEAYYVPLAPHCTCSQLGLTASLHATVATPLFLIHEGYLDGHIMPAGVANVTWKVDADGYASLPQGPGLGVTIDESKFDKVNADPQCKFKWPTPKAPDGAVIDY